MRKPLRRNRLVQLRQEALGDADAVEADIANGHIDGRDRAHILIERQKIGEQLRVREVLTVPVHFSVRTAFVVEDGQAAGRERIHAIDAQVEAPTGE